MKKTTRCCISIVPRNVTIIHFWWRQVWILSRLFLVINTRSVIFSGIFHILFSGRISYAAEITVISYLRAHQRPTFYRKCIRNRHILRKRVGRTVKLVIFRKRFLLQSFKVVRHFYPISKNHSYTKKDLVVIRVLHNVKRYILKF